MGNSQLAVVLVVAVQMLIDEPQHLVVLGLLS
jgi:hypothetical protein